jgi:hypothetical protein
VSVPPAILGTVFGTALSLLFLRQHGRRLQAEGHTGEFHPIAAWLGAVPVSFLALCVLIRPSVWMLPVAIAISTALVAILATRFVRR